MSNTFGHIFRATTFGESHGLCVGAVVDGCPAGLDLSEKDIQPLLDRRRPGGALSTGRAELDKVRIVSGIELGTALGGPITLLVDNRDTKPADYAGLADIPRPSHADFTYKSKYGIIASSGGGRASARETVARVAAGGVAEKFLAVSHGARIVAWVSSVGEIDAPDLSGRELSRADVDVNAVRCPDPGAASLMAEVIKRAARDGDSLGGIVTCVCRGVPAGWGEPVFGKMEAVLASAMLSIPAAKGIEIGSGFAGSRMRGSEHNDVFEMKESGRLGTATNRSGGIQGGITNGEPVVFRVAFKPTASIAKTQQTARYDGKAADLAIEGRHDPCVLPRAVPVVEAMAALSLADMALIDRTRRI